MATDKIISEPYTELENQFIMRLPPEPARRLREALRSGNFLKDRLTIKLENDMRRGEVQFDHYFMRARVVDLPCILESQKTIDNKNFYKTADICQMLICKEDEDPLPSDDEDRTRRKEPAKPNKKYFWPHGITPPLKNVRRRRFRKTLRKKYCEVSEVEKEVKRLLRSDNEAVSVKYEIVYEEKKKEEDKKKTMKKESSPSRSQQQDGQRFDIAEHELFGEALSESDEEGNNLLEGEGSRLSTEDSRLSDIRSQDGLSTNLPTQFSGDMFSSDYSGAAASAIKKEFVPYEDEDANNKIVPDELDRSIKSEFDESQTELLPTEEEILSKMAELKTEIDELKMKRQQKEIEVATIDDYVLKQRLQNTLDNLLTDLLEKELQYDELASLVGN